MKKMAIAVLSIIISFAVCAGSVWAIQENDSNTWVGSHAGGSITTGTDNSFFGYYAGHSTNSGNYNTYIGSRAGYSSTGSRNVFLGYYAGHNADVSNRLYIDNCVAEDPQGDCAPLIYGEFDTRIVKIDGTLIMVTVATPSDKRYKQDIQPLKSSLERVLNLKGVSYTWNQDMVHGAGYGRGLQIGLIAQEVEAVIPELVITDSKGYKALSYDKIVPVLVEAIKEQEAVIREQEKQNIQKEARIMKLENALELMEKRIASIENPAKTIALK